MSRKKIDSLDILSIPEDGKYGYVLEVDLDYPSELHAAHSSFPLAPHKMDITEKWLSPYAKGKLHFLKILASDEMSLSSRLEARD